MPFDDSPPPPVQSEDAATPALVVPGSVLLPGEAGNDDECAVFNLNHELLPAVIVDAQSAADVQAAVAFAAGQHRPVLAGSGTRTAGHKLQNCWKRTTGLLTTSYKCVKRKFQRRRGNAFIPLRGVMVTANFVIWLTASLPATADPIGIQVRRHGHRRRRRQEVLQGRAGARHSQGHPHQGRRLRRSVVPAVVRNADQHDDRHRRRRRLLRRDQGRLTSGMDSNRTRMPNASVSSLGHSRWARKMHAGNRTGSA
jgi:hypothetical protein